MHGKYSDIELAYNQSINALGGDSRTQCWHTSFDRVSLHQAAHTLVGHYGGEGYSDNVPGHK